MNYRNTKRNKFSVSGKTASNLARNTLTGAAQGAATGAFVPVVGPLVGGAIGAGLGLASGIGKGWGDRSAARESRENMEQIRDQYQKQVDLQSGRLMNQARGASDAAGQQIGQAMARSGISGPMVASLGQAQRQRYTDTALDRIGGINAQMEMDLANKQMSEDARLRQDEQFRQQQIDDAFGDLSTSIMGYMNNKEMMGKYGEYIDVLNDAINSMPLQQLQQLPTTQSTAMPLAPPIGPTQAWERLKGSPVPQVVDQFTVTPDRMAGWRR
tara:strand:+ start:5114 stop:5923 length:810 start_codon:yes stop_codon:yes gene_type:complete